MAKGKKEIEEVKVEYLVFDFSDTDVVTIIATTGSKHLEEGKEYEVSGSVAKAIITKGQAKIK
jgi:hypothetical protein